jgi:hypothetical protein
MLAFALFVLVFATVFAVFSGRDCRAAALGGLLGVLLGALNHHRPLLDWLYPKDDKEKEQDDGPIRNELRPTDPVDGHLTTRSAGPGWSAAVFRNRATSRSHTTAWTMGGMPKFDLWRANKRNLLDKSTSACSHLHLKPLRYCGINKPDVSER